MPTGSFIMMNGKPCLLWNGRVLPWSHAGYEEPQTAPGDRDEVNVLTSASIVAMFRAGFRPQVH